MNKFHKIAFAISISVLSLGAFFSQQAKEKEPVISYAWAGSQTPSVPISYYSACDGLEGEQFITALKSFNYPTGLDESDYANDRFKDADQAEGQSSYIISLYTRHTILARNSSASDGNYRWDKWNREHIYTQTRFPNSIYDNHNIFACEGYTNNQRSDHKYANVRQIFYNATEIISDGHNTGCYTSSNYFEPRDEAKGEVARAVLYCALYYGYNITDIAYDANTILNWHTTYQVSNREIYRNNRVYGNQGNRNPFVDHPSYASKVFGGNEYPWDDPLSEHIHVSGVAISQTSATMKVGDSLQLSATVMPENAENKNVRWSSENANIANVNPATGLVKAYSAGNVRITVRTVDGYKEAYCDIVVDDNKKPSSKTGCGGNIITTSVILSSLSVLGIGLLLIKRKVTDK